jgi:hypothetical protein
MWSVALSAQIIGQRTLARPRIHDEISMAQTKGAEWGPFRLLPTLYRRYGLRYFFAGVAGAGEAAAGGASEFHVSRMMSHFPPLFL